MPNPSPTPSNKQTTTAILMVGIGLMLGILFAQSFHSLAQSLDGTEGQEQPPLPSATPVPNAAAMESATGSDENPLYFPIILAEPTPTPVPLPQRVLVCDRPNVSIPDNNPAGVSLNLALSPPGYLEDLNVFVSVSHTWVGDLTISLRPPNASRALTLLERPGAPASPTGCGNDGVQAIFDDQALQYAEGKCASSPAAVGGSFRPVEALDVLFGARAEGAWALMVADEYPYDTGALKEWCLEAVISSLPPIPTPPPAPVSFPVSAAINGMSGQNQALPLDCESRSAVDWAKHFGVWIGELDFFSQLPASDNPEKGFVGNVYGTWGKIPPEDYGVHAEPVAALLRRYGLQAKAVKHLSWDQLRAEVAANRPVIVWVTRSVLNGAPNYYLASSDGGISVVARYEHTVIVTGYTSTQVLILDGSQVYNRSIEQFLDSWSVLQNMAIIAQP